VSDWEFATIDQCWGVWLGEGCDEIDPPAAVFANEADAKEWARAYHAKAEANPDDYRGAAHIMHTRNVQVPFWNNGTDDPHGYPPSTYDEADHLETIARLEKHNEVMRAALEELLEFDAARPLPRTFLAGVRLALKGGAK